MISRRLHGSIKFFFVLKQAVGYVLFWAVVWLLHLCFYGDELRPSNYIWLSFLVPAAAYLEKVARSSNRQSLCGLSKEQVSNITQREVIFALVTVFGAIVMMKDPTASRVFLAIFFSCYAGWITWMNHVGHRMIQRFLYRNREKGATKTVVLASSKEIEKDQAMKMSTNLPGSQLMGYVAFGGMPSAAAFRMSSIPILGDFSELASICKFCEARMILATGIEDRPPLVRSLQKMCDAYGMRLVWVDDKEQKFGGRVDTHQDGSQVYLTRWQEPLEDPLVRAVKRLFDVCFSFSILVTIFPFLCLFVWILQRRYSPGPLFYR